MIHIPKEIQCSILCSYSKSRMQTNFVSFYKYITFSPSWLVYSYTSLHRWLTPWICILGSQILEHLPTLLTPTPTGSNDFQWCFSWAICIKIWTTLLQYLRTPRPGTVNMICVVMTLFTSRHVWSRTVKVYWPTGQERKHSSHRWNSFTFS